jgi:hypothetical protein
MNICELCETEYDKRSRLGKMGRVTICQECADEEGDVQEYTGVMIYDHKTSCEIQINKNPLLTEYLINSTKLKNKGSNMTSNVQQVTKYKKLNKTEGACLRVADVPDYKGKKFN